MSRSYGLIELVLFNVDRLTLSGAIGVRVPGTFLRSGGKKELSRRGERLTD
jgi:hypothetical protein